MEINFQLTPADIAAYQYAVRRRLGSEIRKQGGIWPNIGYSLLMSLGIAVVLLSAVLMWPVLFHRVFRFPEAIAGFCAGTAFILAAIWLNYFRQRRIAIKPGSWYYEPQKTVIGPEGMHGTTEKFESRYLWSIFEDVTIEKSIIILWLQPGLGVVIPRSAFASDAEAQAFVATVKGFIASAAQSGKNLA